MPGAVPQGDGREGLKPLGVAGRAAHFVLEPVATGVGAARTSVSLFDQGLTQVLEASVTGLAAESPYLLALSQRPDGGGDLEPLASFTTNPAGSAIVNATGPIRQLVRTTDAASRRYLVIASGSAEAVGQVVQVQSAAATE